MTLLRSLSVACVALSAVVSGGHAQGDCKRPAARQFKQGETITLSETKTFPCKIVFANTPIVLRGDADPAIGDFGGYVARGPDGRFYATSKGAELYVWSPTGQFLRAFGKEGGGPGEFAKGGKSISFGREGNVYIADNNRRWSVFSPALDFIKTFSTVATGGGGFFSSDGLFVSSGITDARTGSPFGIFDFSQPATDGSPRVVRKFGTPIMNTPRIVAPSTGLNFWAAPYDGPGAAYELELWGTDGTILRTIRRDVPWYPKVSDRGPGPEMEKLSDDGTGIALVTLMIPNATKFEAAAAERDPAKKRALQDGAIDIYLEAIDGNAGVVLASWGPVHPSIALKELPYFFPRSRNGYRREENADGFGMMRIVELRLVAQ